VESEQGKFPSPPGLIATFAAGFNSVASSITVIALPVLLDLFLWFGPRLSLRDYLQPLIDALPRLYTNLAPAETLELAQQFWTDFFTRFNLFAALRTFPVGTPSLLFLEMPPQTPLGDPVTLQAGSFGVILGLAFLLVLAGWLIGAAYFHWVSKVALNQPARPVWKSVTQTLWVSLVWTTVLFVAGLPALMLLGLSTVISPALGQVILFLTGLATLWLLIPFYFSAHGIFTFQMDALNAILNSLRMVRFTFPTTSFFLFLTVLLSFGLRFLWKTPPPDSWWMLVGIVGHAFISTALLAASFIYYRDVNDWLKVVFERLNTQTTSAKG
jgi:hypothetical protein